MICIRQGLFKCCIVSGNNLGVFGKDSITLGVALPSGTHKNGLTCQSTPSKAVFDTSMNFLFFVDDFPPNWSPRVGYLCKYLTQMGHHIYVVSGVRNEKNVYEFLAGYAEEVHFFKPVSGSSRIRRLIDALESLLPVRKLRREAEMVRKSLEICSRIKIDLVFCSTCDMFPAYSAMNVSKLTGLPLHVDFRDLNEQLGKRRLLARHPKFWAHHIRDALYNPLYRIYRRRVVASAKSTSSISDFHKKLINEISQNCHLIYNGFDPDIFFDRQQTKQSKFIISYSGTLGDTSVSNHKVFLNSL